MSGWVGGTFGSLRSRAFLTLWLGTLAAFVAFFMSSAVQGVVAFELTGRNRAVGFVVAAQGLSQGLLGPVGGAMADRLSRKRVVLACQLVITVAFAALAVLVATDLVTIVLLSLGSFAIGAAFSFLGPARNAWVVELVEPGRRGNAIALTQVALNASRIIGPLLAAAVLGVAALGAGGAYGTMTLLYVGALAATVSLASGGRPARQGQRSVTSDIALGIRYIAGHPRLRFLVPSYLLVIMTGFGYITVLPGLVSNELGRDPRAITAVLAVNAIGGLAASVTVAGIADSPLATRAYTGACIAFGLALVASSMAPSYVALTGAMLFVGAGSGGFQTLNGALVSTLAEPEYLGRVMSITFLGFAASNLFSFPFGILADAIGERPALTMTGSAVVVITVIFTILEGFASRRARAPGG